MSNTILFILKLYLHLPRKSKRYNANPVNLSHNATRYSHAWHNFDSPMRIAPDDTQIATLRQKREKQK
jgi:hypothetical protein